MGYTQSVPQVTYFYGVNMSYSMNRVMIIGNVGQSPKISHGATGKRTATFSVATSEKWKTPDGNAQEITEWHNIFVLAEHAANFVANYLGKGDHVVVEGQLQTKEYTDRDGNPRKATSIVVKPFNGKVGLLKASSAALQESSFSEPNIGSDDENLADIPF